MRNELIKNFSAQERSGFSNVRSLLVELYPDHDLWDGVLASNTQAIIFGSNNEAISKRNTPAFGIYKKPGMSAPVFGLRFDDKLLRARLAETLGDDAYFIRFPLAELADDVSSLRRQIEAWSRVDAIIQRMAGSGHDLLSDEGLDTETAVWLADVRCEGAMRRVGQQGFRSRVLSAFSGQCAVTGCAVGQVLDACHIVDHAVEVNYSVSNGLLLRRDIHGLFDGGLLAIDETGRVHLDDSVHHDLGYRALHGTVIRFPSLDNLSLKTFKATLAQRFST